MPLVQILSKPNMHKEDVMDIEESDLIEVETGEVEANPPRCEVEANPTRTEAEEGDVAKGGE